MAARRQGSDERQLSLPFRRPVQPRITSASALRRLQREWDKRLAADGFEDIEARCDVRTGWIDRPRAKLDPSAAEFYRLAPEFGEFFEWDDEQTKLIWQMHSNGASRPEILQALGLSRPREVRTRLEKIRARFALWLRRLASHHQPDDDELDEISNEFRKFGALL